MMGSRRERSEAFPAHHAELVSVCHRERLYISVTGLIGQYASFCSLAYNHKPSRRTLIAGYSHL
jgi:hypothetical protein